MRKGFGVCCIILGVFCLFASLGFILYNHHEEEIAQIASKDILQDVRVNIPDTPNDETILEESISEEFVREEHVEPIDDIPQEMLTAKVDGYDCIGILSIPVLELELPILTDWSYQKLKIAPCHYYGSYYEENFVIAAHNNKYHFGRLSELQANDFILFTDISGTVYCYKVVLLETLPGNATEEMISSGFDLSLYTCTPGGSNRVTVRCDLVQ